MSKQSKIADNFELVELDITGMECVNCAGSIKSYLSKLNGIYTVEVNFTSEVASIEYNPSIIDKRDIISDIRKMGYDVIESDDDEATEKQKKEILKKSRNNIIFSYGLTIVIMLFSMSGHFGININISHGVNFAILFILTSIVVFKSGHKFLTGAITALKNRSADMNTLVALGVLSSYIYSSIITANHIFGLNIRALENAHEVYFETAAMIITLILTGNYLETVLKSKTQTSIKKLKDLQAKFVNVLRNGEELFIPFKKVRKQDIVIIKTGDKIPVDGKIIEGYCVIDESSMTGESTPIEKKKGDNLISGTLMKNGYVKMTAEKVGNETTLSKIITLVKEASNSKPKIQRLADKISGIFVPVVVSVSLLTFLIWYLVIGIDFDKSLLYAVSVLIIACPCALGLASPMAVVIGVGRAAENGILFNNVEAIEKLNKIDTVCFDKTGTLTTGDMEIKEIKTLNNYSTNEMLKYAFSIEKYSNHPIAKSLINYCIEKDIDIFDNIEDINNEDGLGISGTANFSKVLIGSTSLMKKYKISGYISEDNSTKTLYVAIDGKVAGIIVFDEKMKPESREIIERLKHKNIDVHMISGDSKKSTEKIAEQLGINNYSPETLPQEKERIISELQGRNRIVAMIGDGVNDAPSLARANVGIAVGTGQDIAIDSADVILVKGDLRNFIKSINISSKTVSIIKQNIFWAFFYNIITIPLAAGILSPIGIVISPVLAAMFMAFSDIITVMINSLRLKYVNIN